LFGCCGATIDNGGGPAGFQSEESVFVLTESFLYGEETEAEIDRVCVNAGLARSLISNDGKGQPVKEFRIHGEETDTPSNADDHDESK
jgi:hypothetical protein